jgi:tyrosine-protein phosphatase OCA1
LKTAGVPNFGKLNDHIWRSGQPTRAGYSLLVSQGLKTVVNLREEFPQDKDLIPQGVQYIYIPIKDEHAPTEEQARQFMNAASNPANWPLLVHCHAGEGRAGTMAALVRCTLDKWDDSAVMKETNRFISSKVMGLVKPQLASCQRELIHEWESNLSASPLPEPSGTRTEPTAIGSIPAIADGHISSLNVPGPATGAAAGH